MFAYKPELAEEDDDEADDVIEREVEEEEENVSVHDVQETVIDLGDVEVSPWLYLLESSFFHTVHDNQTNRSVILGIVP